MRVLLISTYDLGRQPFGLASPAAWLRSEGVEVDCVDTSRDTLTDGQIGAAGLIAFYLPMHTATRLAAPLIARVRRLNPSARLAAYGLYAPLNASWLRDHGVAARARARSRRPTLRGPDSRGQARALRASSPTPRAREPSEPESREPESPQSPRFASSSPIDRRCRRCRAMRRCRCPTGAVASSGRPSHARLQASMPALSDRPGLWRHLPGDSTRCRDRRRPRAGRGRRAAHLLRRSRFPERTDPRPPSD